MLDPEEECDMRNSILYSKHSRIPSYALWRTYDISKQDLGERLSWWTGLLDGNTSNYQKKTIIYAMESLLSKN